MPAHKKSQHKENRLSHLYRVIRMWVPIHRAKFVVGICTDNQIVEDPGEVSGILRETWAPVFASKTIDVDKAKTLLAAKPITHVWDWSSSHRPTARDIGRFLRHAPNSRTGPDGLPYSACYAS
eukprot:5455405-Karenia_brevis.AAC.1